MIITKCPLCKGAIEVSEDPNIGLQLMCIHCSTDFEVTWLFPFTLDYLEKHTLINLGDSAKSPME